VDRVEALGPDGQAIDRPSGQYVEQFGGDRFGIGLDGELGLRGDVEVAMQGVEQGRPQFRGEQRGRPPPMKTVSTGPRTRGARARISSTSRSTKAR
jgi:hypothetical protein